MLRFFYRLTHILEKISHMYILLIESIFAYEMSIMGFYVSKSSRDSEMVIMSGAL